MSKLQIIALCVLTTILTDKFLINHSTQPITIPAPSIISPNPSPSPNPSISPSPILQNTQNEIILKEIQNLRKEIAAAGSAPTTSPSLIGGMVKISSPQWKKLDVFEKSSTTSKIVSSIAYDTIYFYRRKVDNWYQLDLDGNQSGWVQAQFLQEYP